MTYNAHDDAHFSKCNICGGDVFRLHPEEGECIYCGMFYLFDEQGRVVGTDATNYGEDWMMCRPGSPLRDLTDQELIDILRAQWEGGLPISVFFPQNELPMHWRVIKHLNWKARTILRQAARSPQGIWPEPETKQSITVLVVRGFLVSTRPLPFSSIRRYKITHAGVELLKHLPSESEDDPENEANRRAADRLRSLMRIARPDLDPPMP